MLAMTEENAMEMGFYWASQSGENSNAQFEKYYKKYFNIAQYCGSKNNNSCFPNEFYYLNGQKVPTSSSGSSNRAYYGLSDGTALAFEATIDKSGGDDKCFCIFLVDINGKKRPNTIGKDIFELRVFNDGKLDFSWMYWDRKALVSTQRYACNKNAVDAGYACGALILQDGWQIKDDYPW